MSSLACDIPHPIIAIVGPTASGKSALAQELALLNNGEIVSADSMQIYRGMDIGTGKLKAEDIKVVHWGLDICEPGTAYSAALYQKFARSCFTEITQRGKRAFLCGGTGLYIRAALDDLQFPKGEQEKNLIRDYYTRLAEEQGENAVWELLKKKDPASADLVHPHNVRRVIRAFEMLEEGTSYAQTHEGLAHVQQIVPACLIGLEVEPALLNKRINARVDTMVEQGLVEEVKNLLQLGFRGGITAPQAIGYKEIVAALEGECSLEEALENIKTATRRYGKRQRTWFRKDKRIHWIDANNDDLAELTATVQALLATIEQSST